MKAGGGKSPVRFERFLLRLPIASLADMAQFDLSGPLNNPGWYDNILPISINSQSSALTLPFRIWIGYSG